MTEKPSQTLNGGTDAAGRRIVARLSELAACTEEPGRISRLYLSAAHRQAADLVTDWMTKAGMTTRIDAIGNVIGRYEGLRADAPALWLGSHIDSVPDAGMFDGALGVVTAIEAVSHLHQSRRRMPFAIEVIAFGDEEGSRFASTLSGSRLLAGQFDARILDEVDAGGITRRAALAAFGGKSDLLLQRQPTRLDGVIGYLEVHIEQGPVLETNDRPLGVVTAINGASRGSVEVCGVGGHAGTIPMTMRHDAACAAAEMILAIERRAAAEAGLVATVGRIETPDGAVNSVPGLVRFSIDVRSPSDAIRQAALSDISRDLDAIASRRGVAVSLSLPYQAPAAPCDPQLSQIMTETIESLGIVPLRLPSGAGHDAMSFRGRLPIAMLFVRCRAGISHSPAEFASTADIDLAARALSSMLERLAAVPAAAFKVT